MKAYSIEKCQSHFVRNITFDVLHSSIKPIYNVTGPICILNLLFFVAAFVMLECENSQGVVII